MPRHPASSKARHAGPAAPCRLLLPLSPKLFLGLLLCLSAGSAGAAKAPERVTLPNDVVPVYYDIDFTPDIEHKRFSGTARIDVQAQRPTKTIVLNAVDLQFGQVTLSGVDGAPKIAFDAASQTATLSFAAPIAVGPHQLSIAYTGLINTNPAGLFLVAGETPGSKPALFTQFESTDARRFFPCWDEPGLKASYSLSAIVAANAMAVSNMPVARSEPLSGGRKRVRFAESPKMSSYLLFFAAGDFERVSRKLGSVELGVVVRRGDTAKAAYALDTAAQLLPYYNDYFGLPYPLPKLDLIAASGSSQAFGAMENWGAMLFFERYLLVDPKISTQADRRLIYRFIAHEMAHQWFGDLVTMAWWDDLWLNEGFASWMEVKASDHFHPEWNLWLEEQRSRSAAMGLDARQGTHPIIQPIQDAHEIDQAFDAITYNKGAAVIRMLEQQAGETVFRDSVRRYLNAHANSTAVTEDLWRELDAVAASKLSKIAHDFTRQAGVPLIRVEDTAQGLQLSQARFSIDGAAKDATRWRVPVIARRLDSDANPRDWRGIVARDKPPGFVTDSREGLVVNAGQAGYYRTLYSPAALRPLVTAFGKLPAIDQAGLLDDSYALGLAGQQPMNAFLDLAAQARPDGDPQVLAALATQLSWIAGLYEGQPEKKAFDAFGQRLLQPMFARLGWKAAANESQNTALLRQTLIRTLADLDDPRVIKTAKTHFAAYLKNPKSLSGDERLSVLDTVAIHADQANWEQLQQLARQSKTAVEKQQLYSLLSAARSRDLARQALTLAVSEEAALGTRPLIISSVCARQPELAFDFVLAHLDGVMALLDPSSRDEFLSRCASSSHESAMIPKLRDYASRQLAPGARPNAQRAEAAIAYRAKVFKERLPEISRRLAEQAN